MSDKFKLEVAKQYFVEFGGVAFQGILSKLSINIITETYSRLEMQSCSGEQVLHQFLNENPKLSFLVIKNKEGNVSFFTEKAFIESLGIEGARMKKNNHVTFRIIKE